MEGRTTPLQENVSETPLGAAPEPAAPPDVRFRPAAPRPRMFGVPSQLAAGTRPELALPALASAGLLWLCYFPVAWGWLGWVAVVPLLCLVRAEASGRRLFFCAWLGGLAFFWPVLQWMRVADHRMYYTWAMLATYCSLYFPVTVWLLRRLDRGTRLPLVVTLPLVWVGLEFVRSWLLTGFAWYYLGHTQHDVLPMIQVADLGGVYVVSFLVAAVNAWLFEMLYAMRWFRDLVGLSPATMTVAPSRLRWRLVQGGVVALLLIGALIYGVCRLSEDAFTPGPRLALLQGNLDQRLRNQADLPGDAAQAEIFRHMENLDLVAKLLKPEPDLIVWPETSYPAEWVEVERQVPLDRVRPSFRDEALEAKIWMEKYAKGDYKLPRLNIKPPPANILLGLNARVLVDPDHGPYRYNTALLLYANGDRGGRYDKIHRVPFGEYVPLRDWLPFMNAFAPYENDYSITAGEKLTRLALGKYRFGVLICYEDTDPFLARDYGRASADGPPVDFLVNISNEGWFVGSSEHDEHLAIARFRAIEARRSVARAVNMGISAVIDGNGRVLAPRLGRELKDGKGRVEATVWVKDEGIPAEDLPLSRWHEFKKVPGVLTAVIPIDGRTSLYSQWGDWLPLSCWVIIGGGLLWVWVTRRRSGVPGPVGSRA